MRILAITTPGNGVGYHRLILPLMEMKETYTLFTDFINDEVLQRGFDVVAINRFVPGCSLGQLLEYRKKYDFKLIVDIDDYWMLDPWHILYKTYPSEEIINHVISADMVTVTHDRLRNEVLKLNKRCEILPNALPYNTGQFTDIWHSVDTSPSKDIDKSALRLLWCGGVTHEKDIDILANPFKRIASDTHLKDKLHFIMAGYDDANLQTRNVWHRMISSFLCGFKLNGHLRSPLPPDSYMAFYTDADICIAPLLASKFNSMKSNLKVLEAAAKRLPIIVSDVHPYSDCPYAIKVLSQRDWYKRIRSLVKDVSFRNYFGIANYEWCMKHHHLDKVNVKRKQIYENA